MRILGFVLMIASLACIIYTFVNVVTERASLFSPSTIAGYLFHPASMLAGVALILKSKKSQTDKESE